MADEVTAGIAGATPATLSFGAYEILAKLGEGGMGAVYKARDTRLDRVVALKVVSAIYRGDAEAQKRLQKEARAAARLDHPNICTVYSIEELNGSPCIAMQFVEGTNLKEWIARGPMAPEAFFGFALQLAAGLGEAHRRGVTHRDIKPANLMVTPNGQIKILDFGVARLTGGATDGQTVTAPGTTSGTLGYMAPEQLRGQVADARSDVFSLGLVLVEMLTGKHPFLHETSGATVQALLNQPAPAVRAARPDLPEELDAVLAKALAKDRAARYANAAELFADLEKPARRVVPAERQQGFPERPGPASLVAQKWPMALVLAAGLVAIVWWRPWQGPPSAGQAGEAVSRVPAPAPAPVPASPATPAATKPTIAVLAFSNAGKDSALAHLEMGIPEALTQALVGTERFRTVERTQLDKALAELNLGRSEYVDPATAQKVGRIVGAQYLVMGSYQAWQGQLRINARLMRVETAEIAAARNVTGPVKEALQLPDQLAREFLSALPQEVEAPKP